MNYIDVDSFAGGGGASLGIERALGKPVDVAINHDDVALAMHRANHPGTTHYDNNIWQVNPREIVRRHGPIRLLWASPDCTYFSKAKGSAPIREAGKRSRDLAWVIVHWAEQAKPQIIMLENVEEFAQWGPLMANGKPDPYQRGLTFRKWVGALQKAGYRVEWRDLAACDFGSPTIRKRLFLIARRDGMPIVWPEPTHGPGLIPYRTAADCIDWSIPVHSIFLSKEEGRKVGVRRPLAEATMSRIGRGVWKYVIGAKQPFIAPLAYGDQRIHSLDERLRTATCRRNFHLVSAFLAQHNTGMTGHHAEKPLSTITERGTQQQLVTAHLTRQFGNSIGQSAEQPAPTVTAGGGGKTGLVTAHLMAQYTSNTNGGNGDLSTPLKTVLASGKHHAMVQAFLVKYYGTGGQYGALDAPAPTATTKARIGLVTIDNVDYAIVDIGMRMLAPRELYRAQGFPDSYIIDPEYNGKPLTKTNQIKLCGNSVCPQMAEALARANCLQIGQDEAA